VRRILHAFRIKQQLYRVTEQKAVIRPETGYYTDVTIYLSSDFMMVFNV
jgi:hypothetical protein